MAARTTPRRRPPDAEADDSFEMLPSGKCKLIVDGKTHMFRRPKFGEFRVMREALFERDDTALRLTAELNEARIAANEAAGLGGATEPLGDGPAPPPAPDTRTPTEKLSAALDAKKAARELESAVVDLNIAWVTDALNAVREDTLVDLPDVDEWPPEMTESQFLIDLVQHWRHRPLAHGGNAPTPT